MGEEKELRVIVCGGRLYSNERHLRKTLNELLLHGTDQPIVLIVGGAPGADTLARQWGEAHPERVTVIVEKADWKKHGKAAGPLRNQRMIDKHKPQLVIAFAGGNGTLNMIGKAHKAHIPVAQMPKGPTDGNT